MTYTYSMTIIMYLYIYYILSMYENNMHIAAIPTYKQYNKLIIMYVGNLIYSIIICQGLKINKIIMQLIILM